MKSNIAILLFALLPWSALFGQDSKFQFGLQLQTGFSDLAYRNPDSSSLETFVNERTSGKYSPGITFLGRYAASKRFAFQVGLGYTLSGYKVKQLDLYQTTPNMPEPTHFGTLRSVIYYHDINLSFHAKAKPIKALAGFYILGGVSNQFDVGRRETLIFAFDAGGMERSTENISSVGRKFRQYNLRGDVGLGYEFETDDFSILFVEPFFGYNLFPIFTEGEGKYRQYLIGLNVGFVF